MKTGLGTFACSDGEIEVGAITAVNAFADVYDGRNQVIAGLLSADGKRIDGTIRPLKNCVAAESSYNMKSKMEPFFNKRREEEELEEPETTEETPAVNEQSKDMGYDITFNTTISCLVTNAKLTKAQCNKLASILHDGYARAIKPVHSIMDGDTIFVMATGEKDVNFDAFAALATDIVQYSVIDGAISAESAYGLPAAREFLRK